MIARKTRCSITFTSLIQMEGIKDSHVDKNMIYKKQILKKIISSFFQFLLMLGMVKIVLRMALITIALGWSLGQ